MAKRLLQRITCVEDLHVLAKQRVPRPFYDYVDSGSWTEGTYHGNEVEFSRILLKQKVMVDISKRNLSAKMLGIDVAMPVALAPCGFGGMMSSNGEIKAALAAEKFGVPFSLSTMSICSIEDVAKNTSKPFWFQLYVMRDRDFTAELINRAKAAKCSALILTVDLQVLGQRHKDVKNGLGLPPEPTLRAALDILSKPRWCLDMLSSNRFSFGNIVGHAKNVSNMASLSAWTSEQFDPTLTWKDVEWIKKLWGGKLIIKGILDSDDAHHAVESGGDALVVSNHGGRQLDGAPPTIAVLPAIVDRVGKRAEVFLDSGVRSGQDVLKAIALGADGVFMGRPWLYGLAAHGEDGVRRCLEIVYKELDLTMGFTGRTSIANVNREILLDPDIYRRYPRG